ncbi:hypothetical protein [Ornithobacterium rhinotracheale]
MKKTLSLLVILFITKVFAQSSITDSTLILYRGSLDNVRTSISSYDCSLSGIFPSHKYVKNPFISFAGVEECKHRKFNYKTSEYENTVSKFIKLAYDKKYFYLPIEDSINKYAVIGHGNRNMSLAKLDKAIRLYNEAPNNIKDTFTKKMLEESEFHKIIDDEKELDSLKSELKTKRKYRIAFFQSNPTSGYSSTGMEFKIMNLNKKTIKYIYFYVVGYNDVDDPVKGKNGEFTQRLKCIGPVKYQNASLWSFDYVWFTDVVSYTKLKKFKIIYMDGTEVTLNYNTDMDLSEYFLSAWDRMQMQ